MTRPDDVTSPSVAPGVALPRPGAIAVATVLATLALAVLWTGVVTGMLLAALDPVVELWIVAGRAPGLVVTAVWASVVGQPAVMIGVLVVAAGAGAWRSHSWTPVLIGAGALVLLGLADNGVKAIVARPRPLLAWHAMPAHGLSFPSGHALWSAGVLLLVVVIVGPIRGRPVLAVTALLVVVVVSGSRLVVGVHYPSDVLAGWSLAVIADGIVLLVAGGVARGTRTTTTGRRRGSGVGEVVP